MNIKIVAVGKIKEKFYKDAIDEYLKRLGSYTNIEIIEVADESASESLSSKEIENIKDIEADRIIKKIKDNSFIVTLEIKATGLTSEDFADFIKEEMLDGAGRDLVFVIGGSNGMGQRILDLANKRISFGKMTYPHQLMRVILTEQIYRAFRIINNHPYHK